MTNVVTPVIPDKSTVDAKMLRHTAESLIGQRLLTKIDQMKLLGIRVRGKTKLAMWHPTAPEELGSEFTALLRASGLSESDLDSFYSQNVRLSLSQIEKPMISTEKKP